MSQPQDDFDDQARALTKRLLTARERDPSAMPVEPRVVGRLKAVGVLVGTMIVVSASILLASYYLHASPSPAAGPPTHAPATVPAVTIKPTPPSPTSVQTSCPGGGPGTGTGPCVAGSSSIQFVSDTVGWLVGPRSIAATIDGGRHWSAQLDPHQPLIGADFLDIRHGWVVGAHNLFSTQDGGLHWQSLAEPGQQMWSVHFVSPSHGWGIVGEDPSAFVVTEDGMQAPSSGAHVAVTNDGGRTWQEQPSPANAQSACFVDGSNGWLGTAGAIYRSHDGGHNWQLSFAEPPASGQSAASDTAFVECAASGSAWVLFLGQGAALSHAPYISFAAADGVHWRPILEEAYIESATRPQVQAPDGPGSYPGPFSVVSPTIAVYFGWTPPEGGYGVSRMVVATGGGAVLSAQTVVPDVNNVISAAFVSPSRGWVVGVVYTGSASTTLLVLATNDGGHTWSTQFSAPG